MKVRSPRIESSPKLMIIPMIDIIFFLLVFFMMSTLHMVSQKALPVSLPQAAAAQEAESKMVSVSLLADGKLSVDERVVSVEEMKEEMRRSVRENPGLAVVLRADKAAEHGKVVGIMDALKEAGIKKMAIAAEKKGM